MWPQFREIKKFTTKKEVDRTFGKPQVQIGNLPVYYYGNGFLIGYPPIFFNNQEPEKIKYGNKEMFATKVFHFSDIQALEKNFRIENFTANDVMPFDENIISDFINYDSTFSEILNWTNTGFHNVYHSSGETRRLINGKVERINVFIIYGQYKLYFYKKEINSKSSGFEFTLSE